jgi:hypothetical protein
LVIGERANPRIANSAGSNRSCVSLYRAGTSFLLVKSPDAPKIMTVQGSAVLSIRTPSRNGLLVVDI